jgi:hypothetical protein
LTSRCRRLSASYTLSAICRLVGRVTSSNGLPS